MSAILAVTDLSVASRHRTIVHDVSFAIAPGERLGLIGESGSGKSLTSLAVMGLLPESLHATGTVLAAGEPTNLLELPEREFARRRGRDMSIVFQEPMTALNPLMRVGRQVAEVMTLHHTQPTRQAAAERAVALLQDVGLDNAAEAANAYPHQLSGGQRQRVMLAMALANDPALLICDEPTTALDVTVQRQVLDLMLELVRRRGTGLLFITHDLAVVASVCDRVLVLHEGTIVESGPISEVFSNPRQAYTRGLLAASDLNARDANGHLFTVTTSAAYRASTPQVDGHAQGGGAARDSEATQDGVAVRQAAQRAVAVREAARATPASLDSASDTHATAPSSPVISIRALEKTYVRARTSMFAARRHVRALRGITLDIPAGARYGIVGESGSGKSTLLKTLAGLEAPTDGDAHVLGVNLNRATPRELARVRSDLQLVFQDPMSSLDPRQRVLEIVQEPLLNPANLPDERPRSASARKDAVARMLTAVGLDTAAMTRYPHEFSGGQRQRISIARALVCEPRILLADEPVSALDVSVRAQVLNLLADLVTEHQLTLVFVSHDLAVVRHLCDRVAVMRSGTIVEQGPTAQLYERPQHAYTQQLLAATPTLRPAAAARAEFRR